MMQVFEGHVREGDVATLNHTPHTRRTTCFCALFLQVSLNMGCGASSATDLSVTTTKFTSHEEQAREQRRNDALEKYKSSEKDKSKIFTYPLFKVCIKEIECDGLCYRVSPFRRPRRTHCF